LHYPDDNRVHQIKYEYLLGPDLLIANVLKPKKATWKVFLPNDTWIHVWSGKELGGGWHEVDAVIGHPPIFYRKGCQYENLFSTIRDF
jgi:alpha-glucosidase